MRAILVRVGVDHSYGGWNAPVDPISGRFVYVPIPDNDSKSYHPGLERSYTEILNALEGFCTRFNVELLSNLNFPEALLARKMHLDPDFKHLTYGDRGDRRGLGIKTLREDDLLVFYAGLRSIRFRDRLVYALVGLYVVKGVEPAESIPRDRWQENAHTRWTSISGNDVIVRAKAGVSGRLLHCIPIGEWRDRAYRVTRKLLSAWGGLTVKDGYIQRSARPPEFSCPEKFYAWFLDQGVPLLNRNN
jgi:hypothetical protein